MLHPSRLLLTLTLALLAPAPALAFVGGPSSRPGGAGEFRADRSGFESPASGSAEEPAAWQAFRGRHGDWRATWASGGSSPRTAVGPPIVLSTGPLDPDAVDRGVRAFVSSHADLFGAPALDLVRCQRAGRVWYASYRQSVRGVPVLFEDWEFRVNERGGLMAFRTGARAADASSVTRPGIGAAEARAAAGAALGLAVPGDAVTGGDDLFLIAVASGELRLAREVEARVADPAARWIVLVDAADGRVLWRHDRVRHDVSGVASGEVHPDLPTDPLVARPLRDQRVTVGGTDVFTDALGGYAAAAGGTVDVLMQLAGRYCDVNRQDWTDASFSTSAADPAVVSHLWTSTDSHDAERDAFYHINRVHEYLKGVDPGFVGNDYPMPCAVNIGNSCNAFWDGTGVNFFAAGNGCPNTATMPDVVYHEYGHGVNDNLYIQAGSGFGMLNGALHEGLADVLAGFLQDTPVMGKGFFGPGTSLRDLDNALRWPDDATPDPHQTGLIIAGALWDLRQAIGLPAAAHLSHFAKYGRPDGFDDGEAMGRFFIETLIADDDDGNLANGSPHSPEIVEAFNSHGIGTGLLLRISHSPTGDQFSAGPYPLYATIQYDAPLGGIAPGSEQVVFSINGGLYGALTMTATGSPGEYLASIPAPEGSLVRYYFRVADTFGSVRTLPQGGALGPYLFLAGATTSYLIHDHESDAGWSVGYPGDGATTGLWQWLEPTGTDVGGIPCQPEVNHTQFGLLCYATGNALVGYPAGYNDVDDGATSLLTGLLDPTLAGPDAIIEYYRWYSNQLGSAPEEDHWRVYITNDGGGSWVPVEDTHLGESAWRRVVFFVNDYVTPTDNVRLRFVAEDSGEPSLVEAAVDDLRILSFNNRAVGVTEAVASRPLELSAAPNPSQRDTRIRFRVARAGFANLRLYDVGGRRVRDLFAGAVEPGERVIRWDGTDQQGRPVANGLYLARLTTTEGDRVCRIARAR